MAVSWWLLRWGLGMAGPTVPGTYRDDQVLPVTRWLSVVIIPFLVVAFVGPVSVPG